jgi:hypothetical protein
VACHVGRSVRHKGAGPKMEERKKERKEGKREGRKRKEEKEN